MSKQSGLREVPGVGVSIEADLRGLGFREVRDLVGRDPEEMYARLCAHQGVQVDRCMLYVFRCAVYFAQTPDADPELLRWWAWKDAADPPLHLLRVATRR